jgi:hypothetical protein
MGIATFRITHLFGSFEKAYNNFNVLRSDKSAKFKQQAAISFPLHFLKYSLISVLRGGSR